MEILLAIGTLLGVGALAAVILVIASAIRGYVAAKLWLWFVVPTFGLPPLSVTAAFGIALLLSYTSGSNYQQVKKEYRESSELATAALSPLIVLLLGYLTHIFFM